MADRLANGNVALALLENTIATGAVLAALILAFGQIFGAHFNPVVTLMEAFEKGLPWAETLYYVLGQLLGGVTGAVVAHLMFSLPVISFSRHARSGPPQAFSEFVATFGLASVIWGCSRLRSNAVAFAAGAYITAAYWFTASTSFANPMVTIARCLSDTFAGIRPVDVPWFIISQFLGGTAATMVFRWLVPNLQVRAKEILLVHDLEQNP
jgi:glycerol uptake facilitator-like aquaporin